MTDTPEQAPAETPPAAEEPAVAEAKRYEIVDEPVVLVGCVDLDAAHLGAAEAETQTSEPARRRR